MSGYCGNEIIARLPEHRAPVAAEIGVDQGRTSAWLMARRPDLRVYMVERLQAEPDPGSDYAKAPDPYGHRAQGLFR